MYSFAVQYSPGLVALSILISVLSAYAAFSLAERMHSASDGTLRRWWLLGGSCAMGAGIWSMHYLGMLAMRLPVEVYYFFPIVLASLMMAVCASAVALIVVSGNAVTWKHLAGGGLLMGAGIAGMHYTGMAAMRTSAMADYSLWVVALSGLVAVSFSWMALWIAVTVRVDSRYGEWMRLTGATVMGLGIASMHYIAMSGMTYMPGGVMRAAGRLELHGSTLGGAGVGLTTLFILLVAMATAALDKRRYTALEESQRALLEAQTSLLEANRLLNELTIRDGLTGLHNRRHFDAVFDLEWRRAVRIKKPVALLMLDVDYFKSINDTYGHLRGDECLEGIARALEAAPRRGHDLIARLGGDEFVVLLPGANEAGAMKVAKAIRAEVLALNMPNTMSECGIVTVSIGVSVRTPRIGDSSEVMLHEADKALYAAKRLGRNRIEILDGSSLALREVSIDESPLRRAS